MYYGGNYGHLAGQQQAVQSHAGSLPSPYNRPPGVSFTSEYFPQPDGDVNTMGAKIPAYGGFAPSSTNYGYNPTGNYLRPGNTSGK